MVNVRADDDANAGKQLDSQPMFCYRYTLWLFLSACPLTIPILPGSAALKLSSLQDDDGAHCSTLVTLAPGVLP